MSVQTAKLIVSLVDQATGPARAINNAMARLNRASQVNARQLATVQRQMIGAAGAAYAVAAAISSPTKAAMEFESAMSDVRKVVDFETPEQFGELSRDIIGLSKELPITANGIAEIVAAAGQAGMVGAELLEFAEMAAKVGVAFDISADQSGEALAKIKTALSLTVSETSLLADGINHLTNNMASDAPGLINFMRRVASTGEQYGFAAVQTAAIGSAMIAAGAEANVAATSFRNVGRALTLGTAATTAQNEAYERLGLKATEVAKSMQEDATGTLQDVLERIRALPREIQAATLSQLFGNEARALAPLVENLELYKTALESVAEPSEFLGSAAAEYAVRADTAANKLAVLKNQTTAVAIAIGDSLVSGIVRMTEVLGPVLGAIEAVVRANPELVASLVTVVGGLVALRVAVIAARFAFLFLKGGVLSTAIGVTKGAGLLVSGAGIIATGFARMRAAVLGASMLSAMGGGGFFAGLIASLGGVATAIGGAAAAITAPIWAVVGVFAAAGLLVLNYWEPISNFFSGFASVIIGAYGEVYSAVGSFAFDRLVDLASMFGVDAASVTAAIQGVTEAAQNIWNAVTSFITALPGQLGNWLADIFTINDYSDQEEAGFRNAGERFGQALIDGIKAIGQGIFDWFAQWPSLILQAIGSIDLSSIFKMPDFSWIPGLGGGKTEIEARASGGPVSANRPYFVGEQGTEMFVPDTSGHIIDAVSTARAISGSVPNIPSPPSPPSPGAYSNDNAANYNGAVSQSVTFGDIIIHNSSNGSPQQIAKAVGDEVAFRVRGEFTDGGQ